MRPHSFMHDELGIENRVNLLLDELGLCLYQRLGVAFCLQERQHAPTEGYRPPEGRCFRGAGASAKWVSWPALHAFAAILNGPAKPSATKLDPYGLQTP